MAAHSDFDFVGNYDESRQAGLLHVADHHVAPGKKQWTWGNGDFGRAWDRNLTDADGPYIELMTGVFTDNQPDFSWLKPQEEKTFVQYFLPYKGLGRVGNATRDAAVGLQLLPDGRGEVRVYVTGEQPGAVIRVQRGGDCLYEARADLSPQGWFGADFAADGTLHDCEVTVEAGDRTLVRYRMYEPELRPIPAPAEPLGAPEELRTTEELYLAATHLEQYRHATRDPADYYREGLRRDPTDLRLNDGYGLLLFRQGQIRQSIACFEKAVQKQTWKNPNPYQGACFFHLGLALEADGQHRKAYDAFYKSTWSAETQSAGFYWLACLEARRGNLEQALEFVGLSLVRNWHNMNGRCLKAALLRHLGRDNTALLAESLAIDPLQMGCLYEESRRTGTPEVWRTVMRQEAHNYLDLALHYAKAGLLEEAVEILQACPEQSPMPSYYEGYLHGLAGDEAAARACCLRAEHLPAPRCYPNRVEEIAILEYAIRLLGRAPRAHALLGCLLYDKKQADAAIAHWEASVQQDPGQVLVHRNLAIARYNKQGDADAALREMEQARRLDPGYPRLLLEYDQLAARLGRSNAARLQLLEENLALVEQRDDLMLRYVTLLNCEGRCEEALQILLTRRFHPWEGGEGKVSAQYRYALIRLAKDCLNRGENDRAVQLLEQSKTYPDTLGEGKLPNVPDNEADYWQGVALRAMGREPEAAAAFLRAASGPQEPGRVLYYNDQPSDFIYYQGLAQRAMGNEAAARKAFHKLLTYGETHLFDAVAYDFFAVSLPEIEVFADDIALRNRQYCNYLRALGCAGLGRDSRTSARRPGRAASRLIVLREKVQRVSVQGENQRGAAAPVGIAGQGRDGHPLGLSDRDGVDRGPGVALLKPVASRILPVVGPVGQREHPVRRRADQREPLGRSPRCPPCSGRWSSARPPPRWPAPRRCRTPSGAAGRAGLPLVSSRSPFYFFRVFHSPATAARPAPAVSSRGSHGPDGRTTQMPVALSAPPMTGAPERSCAGSYRIRPAASITAPHRARIPTAAKKARQRLRLRSSRSASCRLSASSSAARSRPCSGSSSPRRSFTVVSSAPAMRTSIPASGTDNPRSHLDTA